MSATVFVDTNVFVYARDASEPEKQAVAAQWVRELWTTQAGRTSVQVLSEYYATVTRKLKPGLPWLLFVDPASVTKRYAVQLGLGAGAITKFCHKKLRMRTTAIELNPQVLAVCRSWFKLPPDSDTLRVVLADAAQEIRKSQWLGTVDALAVDLYDHDAAAPVLDSAEFYADCRNLLTDDGIMTVNLFGRTSSYERSLARMAEAFGEEAMWAFRPTREGNTVVLAQRTPRALDPAALQAASAQVQARWDLPTTRWPKIFVRPW